MRIQRAFIKADACIGCTRCIDVCPTDAIIGAQHLLHSVIIEDCIGCERCVPACPVDCIELKPMPTAYDPSQLQGEDKQKRAAYVRDLAHHHQLRRDAQKAKEKEDFEQAKRQLKGDALKRLLNRLQ